VPCRTFHDYFSFAIHLLQLKAFSHIMSNMITKSIIYGVIDLRISSSEFILGPKLNIGQKNLIKIWPKVS
jgi:hypothetical protein